MTALIALTLLAADPVEVPKHLAETLYEADLAEAKRIYELSVTDATERCKAALERASKSATMLDDLDKAVAYRDRAKALVVPTAPATAKPLLGKFEFRYDNQLVRHYVFGVDGKAEFSFASTVPDAKPVPCEIYWFTRKGELFGL